MMNDERKKSFRNHHSSFRSGPAPDFDFHCIRLQTVLIEDQVECLAVLKLDGQRFGSGQRFSLRRRDPQQDCDPEQRSRSPSRHDALSAEEGMAEPDWILATGRAVVSEPL